MLKKDEHLGKKKARITKTPSLEKKFEVLTYDTKNNVESIVYARATTDKKLMECLESAARDLSFTLEAESFAVEYEADLQNH